MIAFGKDRWINPQFVHVVKFNDLIDCDRGEKVCEVSVWLGQKEACRNVYANRSEAEEFLSGLVCRQLHEEVRS